MSFLALWLGVGVLGGLGAAARFLIDAAVSSRSGGRIPVGTFAVNLSGSVVLGLLAGVALRGDAFLLAGTATIGSYTTFSTWMLESHRLAEDDRRWTVAANVLASVLLGVAAAAAGRLIGGG
jgi:CrcB protein